MLISNDVIVSDDMVRRAILSAQVEILWRAVFTFIPYLLISIINLLISINEFLISRIQFLISINEFLISIN